MKRISFISTILCTILVLAVTAYGYPNPAAYIPQDNTSVSVTTDMSPPNSMGILTANDTAMFSGTAPPVIANTESAAQTFAAHSLTSAIINSPPTTQYSDVTAITMTISGFERAGPMTRQMSSGLANAIMTQFNDAATNTEGVTGISPPIVGNDYLNQSNANATKPMKEVRFNYIGNLIIDV